MSKTKQNKNETGDTAKSKNAEAKKAGAAPTQAPPLNPQELMFKHSFFKGQIEQALEELRNLELVKGDHLTAKATLENMKELNSENESLVPIGANIFMAAKVDDKENVLVDIGSKVIIKKSISEALSRVDSLIDELTGRERELTSHIQASQMEIDKIMPQLQALEQIAKK